MRRINKLFTLISLSSICLSAGATTVLSLSPEQLVERAPIVVYGQVVQIEVDSLTGRRTAIFEATEVAKSPQEFRSQRDFYIPLLNRAIPHRDLMEWVAGAPELKLREELVVFLRPIDPDQEGVNRRNDTRRIFALEGFQQAKLRVFRDEAGVRRLATWAERPEREPTPPEVRAQKSSARVKTSRKGTPESQSLARALRSEAPSMRTLDSLLNAARSAGGAR